MTFVVVEHFMCQTLGFCVFILVLLIQEEQRMRHNTGLLEMIVGVLTTCHTQYT